MVSKAVQARLNSIIISYKAGVAIVVNLDEHKACLESDVIN